MVETVEEECTMKFVFDNTEELFPTAKVHVKAPNINCVMKPHVDNIEPMFDATQEQLTTTMEDHIHNNDPVTPVGLTNMLHLDFLRGKD